SDPNLRRTERVVWTTGGELARAAVRASDRSAGAFGEVRCQNVPESWSGGGTRCDGRTCESSGRFVFGTPNSRDVDTTIARAESARLRDRIPGSVVGAGPLFRRCPADPGEQLGRQGPVRPGPSARSAARAADARRRDRLV